MRRTRVAQRRVGRQPGWYVIGETENHRAFEFIQLCSRECFKKSLLLAFERVRSLNHIAAILRPESRPDSSHLLKSSLL
jgi:hypothetical protein